MLDETDADRLLRCLARGTVNHKSRWPLLTPWPLSRKKSSSGATGPKQLVGLGAGRWGSQSLPTGPALPAAFRRLSGLASVDVRDPVAAVAELHRRVAEGFVGLRLLPWLWERPPDHRLF